MPLIDYRVAILFAAATALVFLAGLIFFLDKKSLENRLFSIWLFLVAAWGVTMAAFLTSGSSESALFWMRAAYASAILCITHFFYFALYFKGKTVLDKRIMAADLSLLFLFVILIMFSPFIVAGVGAPPNHQTVTLYQPGWYIFAVSLMIHFLGAHYVLFKKYQTSTGIKRKQLMMVMGSIFIGGEIFGVLFNLVLPSPVFNNWDWIWLGPTASAVFIAPAIAYSMTRYKLFNVKGIITEMVVIFTFFFVLIDVVLSSTRFEFILRSSLAAVIIFLGVVLIKAIREEDKQKNKLQHLASELAAANVKLEQRDQMRSEFISMASHQLRTPVSVMKGYISLMLDGDFGRIPKKILDKLQLMFEMNERLVLLVNNMLNVSRIEKNRIDFGFGDVQIDEVGASVVREMQQKAEAKNLKLKFNKPKFKVPNVISDSEKVREIMVNLIDNAIKYTAEGSVELGFELEKDYEKVVGYVKDSGHGMTEEDAKHVFEKFFRAEMPNVPREHGTGLGLYIVTRFLHGMGGEIWIAETAPGKGTTFKFSVPFKPPEKVIETNE